MPEVENLKSEKNTTIAATRKATKARRKDLRKICYELKVVDNKLSNTKRNNLAGCFREAKWIKNYTVTAQYPFEVEIGNTVPVHTFNNITQKCDIIENRPLEFIGSQMKQSMVESVQQDIINLSKSKAAGRTVGSLKPVKEVTTIPLKQHKVTFTIFNNHTVRIQNIGKLRVKGTEQIFENAEFEIGESKLIHNANGYFLHVLVYLPMEPKGTKEPIAMDMGVADPIVLSRETQPNGTVKSRPKPDLAVPFSKRLKRLHKNLSRKDNQRTVGGKEASRLLRKEYLHWKNQKQDKANKFIHMLKQHSLVVIQDDYIAAWKMLWGRKLNEVDLGRIKCMLERLQTSIAIGRFLPTTKECPICLKQLILSLNDRLFHCPCGFCEDRDEKAAEIILCLGLS